MTPKAPAWALPLPCCVALERLSTYVLASKGRGTQDAATIGRCPTGSSPCLLTLSPAQWLSLGAFRAQNGEG